MSVQDHDAPDQFDLAQFDDGFQQAEVEDHEFDPVPDGKYQVRVEKAELTRSREAGTPMIKWTLRIIGSAHADRLLWKYNVLREENMKWVKTDLHICGLDIEKMSELPDRLEHLLDVTLEVTKRTKDDRENVYFNRRIEIGDLDSGYESAAAGARAQF